MKRRMSYVAVIAVIAVCGLGSATAQQEARRGTVTVPASNVEVPEDVGRRAHTNFLIFVPGARSGKQAQPNTSSGPSGETPGSLSCIYKTWADGQISGCPTDGTYTVQTSGGSNVIAIVDAYDYPTAENDFQVFSQTFSLPYGNQCGPSHNAACFTKVYASSQPRANCGWAQEAALDIE
jgi:kumamolisin